VAAEEAPNELVFLQKVAPRAFTGSSAGELVCEIQILDFDAPRGCLLASSSWPAKEG